MSKRSGKDTVNQKRCEQIMMNWRRKGKMTMMLFRVSAVVQKVYQVEMAMRI